MDSYSEKNINSNSSTDTTLAKIKSNSTSSNNIKNFIEIFKITLVLSLLIFIYFYPFQDREVGKMPIISQLKDGQNYNIDSNYEKVSPRDDKYIYIPVVGTNDFHGTFFPTINHFYSEGKKVEYKTGGLEYISKYINILKNEFGDNRVLYFDSGDQFMKTPETLLFDGQNILEFFSTIGLNATTLGNIDYLHKREWIENIIKKTQYPYLINNIKDIVTKKTKGALGDNQKQSQIFEIKLNDKEIIKIGVIGLTLNVGKDKKFFDIGNKETWDNIEFLPYHTNLEEESKKLKDQGATAIILVSHIGLTCYNVEETSKINMYTMHTKQSECEHTGNSLLYKFIQNLKPNTIDAIIGGDIHNNVHHWVNNIPIMITTGKAKYVNIMYLPFKKEDNKYILVNKDIKIEGPLPSCEKVFINLNNCEKIEDNNKNLKLTKYYWHKEKMERDEMTKPLFDKYYDLYKKASNNKVGGIKNLSKQLLMTRKKRKKNI